jgi:hypothetical protein
MRTPYSGSVPVAGRPAFLRLTVIDFAIITYNVKASRGEALDFRPGSNPSHKGVQMAQADFKNSITALVIPSRRLFLSQAAGLAAGVTALA